MNPKRSVYLCITSRTCYTPVNIIYNCLEQGIHDRQYFYALVNMRRVNILFNSLLVIRSYLGVEVEVEVTIHTYLRYY